MKRAVRRFLGNFWFIHGLVLLGLVALWGYIETGVGYILLGMALSFLGALCGALVRIIDKFEGK